MSTQKKVVAICSSPKAGNPAGGSLTEKFLGAFLDGYSSAQSHIFYPYKMKIAPCAGCSACWFKTPGVCAIDDDMAKINEQLQEADLIILATPIYHMCMNAQMKTVLDRTLSIFNPLIYLDQNGHFRHAHRKPKEHLALLISTCSYPEQDTFDALKAEFAAVCRNSHWQNAGEILISASMRASLPGGGGIDAQLAAVKEAGAELAQSGDIPAGVWQRIAGEQVDVLAYLDAFNAAMTKLLPKHITKTNTTI